MIKDETSVLTQRQIRDLKVLAEFISCYCDLKHKDARRKIVELPEVDTHLSVSICEECVALLRHGVQKRIKCPLEPKPTCRKCHVHCYGGEYRAKIREIMGFSGRRMIMKGRLDYLWHYFF